MPNDPVLPDTATDSAPDASKAQTPPAGWEGILVPGERILWQGRPQKGIEWGKLIRSGNFVVLFVAGFGVVWTLFAINMLWGAGSRAPMPVRFFFPLFGVFFIAMSLRGFFGGVLAEGRLRRGTFYTLTTHAAYIATDVGGRRSLDRFPLEETEQLRLTGGHYSSVIFGRGPKKVPDPAQGGFRTAQADIGFEFIDEARSVFAKMRDARASRIKATIDQDGATD